MRLYNPTELPALFIRPMWKNIWQKKYPMRNMRCSTTSWKLKTLRGIRKGCKEGLLYGQIHSISIVLIHKYVHFVLFIMHEFDYLWFINVSMVLGNLGIKSTALGFAAGFTGAEIIRRIEQMGVKADFIPVSNGISRINLKLKSIDGTEINGCGPEIDEEFRFLLILKAVPPSPMGTFLRSPLLYFVIVLYGFIRPMWKNIWQKKYPMRNTRCSTTNWKLKTLRGIRKIWLFMIYFDFHLIIQL